MRIIFIILIVVIFVGISHNTVGYFYNSLFTTELLRSYVLAIMTSLYCLILIFKGKKITLSKFEIISMGVIFIAFVGSSIFGYQYNLSVLGSLEWNFGIMTILSILVLYICFRTTDYKYLISILKINILLLAFIALLNGVMIISGSDAAIISLVSGQKNTFAISYCCLLSITSLFKNPRLRIILDILLILGIFILKSYFIFIVSLYILINRYVKYTISKYFFSIILIGLSAIFILDNPSKLHSLISRYYIYETVFSIIGDNIKYLFFGFGSENLATLFLDYKVTELYVFENLGFTADRVHSPLLGLLFHYGITGILVLSIIFIKIYPIAKSKNLLSFFIILLISSSIHFLGIYQYILIVLVLSLLFKDLPIKDYVFSKYYLLLLGCMVLLSIIINLTYNKPVRNYKNKDILDKVLVLDNYKANCNLLINNKTIPEYAFLCSDISYFLGDKSSGDYYLERGICALPHLWDNNSDINTNYLVQHTITGNRFYNNKYLHNKKSILQGVTFKNFCNTLQ